ncbi:MAG: hypothetical protein HWN68_06475 [Desulfobacterales bacterium]|nr:hypothetical protein [Desulfobacterales bacterium]
MKIKKFLTWQFIAGLLLGLLLGAAIMYESLSRRESEILNKQRQLEEAMWEIKEAWEQRDSIINWNKQAVQSPQKIAKPEEKEQRGEK